MAVIAIERIKTTRNWILYAVLTFLIALNLASGVRNYLNNRLVYEEQGVTWLALWGQSGLLFAFFCLPIVISVRAAMAVRVENENHNWRRMASYDAAVNPVYRSKIASLLLFCGACQLLYLALFLATGILLGFDPGPGLVGRFVLWGLGGWVGSCAVALVQFYAALRTASVASAVTVGVLGTIGGFILTVVFPFLGTVFPYTQIGAGMRVRALDSFTGTEAMAFLAVNLALVVGFALAGARYVQRREY
ncbi:hypothetical protein F4561_004235 [Lipingzhangella halophila]|uniref:ABC-2 type transport system permease protein n=1 Tax=Lipingzhangella halophila TaxID=1783352 RepID=A0A7W7RK30_9ACTN|nr:ABC transporter permease [Lipingzhangella halophila]MBB4933415.1 hypothetical protein [Lipingzhangella halophila]